MLLIFVHVYITLKLVSGNDEEYNQVIYFD